MTFPNIDYYGFKRLARKMKALTMRSWNRRLGRQGLSTSYAPRVGSFAGSVDV